MHKFLTTGFALLVFTYSVGAAESAPKKEASLGVHVVLQSLYMATFANVNEYLKDREDFGYLKAEESTKIKDRLTALGVRLDGPMPKVTVIGKKIKFGEATFTVNINGDVTLPNGRIVRPKERESALEAFERILSAGQEKVAASFWSHAVLPEAEASSISRATDSVLGYLGTGLTYAALRVGALATGFGALVCGAVTLPLDLAVYSLRWAVYNNTVECDGANYSILNYPSYLSTVASDFRELWDSVPSETKVPMGLMGSACVLPAWDALGFPVGSRSARASKNAFNVGNNHIAKKIEDAVVTKVLGSKEGCTPENAAKVENYLDDLRKQEIKKLAAENGRKMHGLGHPLPGSGDHPRALTETTH